MSDGSGAAGHDARLYYSQSELSYDSDGSFSGSDPGEGPINLIRDVTLTIDGAEIDVTSRGGFGWREKIPGLRSWSASFNMIDDPTDTAYGVLKNALFNNTTLGFMILNALTGSSAAYGLRGNAFVTSMERGEPLDDAQTLSVTITGSRAAHWVEGK